LICLTMPRDYINSV